MTAYVLDSYAILAVTRRELPADRVLQLMAESRHQHWMSVINLGEVYYRTVREATIEDAVNVLAWLRQMPIQLMEVDIGMAIAAAELKAAYPLSYADCFAAALAQRIDAKVITGDFEFEQLERAGIVEIEWLPPKPKSRRAR